MLLANLVDESVQQPGQEEPARADTVETFFHGCVGLFPWHAASKQNHSAEIQEPVDMLHSHLRGTSPSPGKPQAHCECHTVPHMRVSLKDLSMVATGLPVQMANPRDSV